MTTQTAPVLASRDPALHVAGLSKTFGHGELAVTAVGGVDMDVHPGEVVLIMGPSGSGKTTLLLLLGAMLRPTAGVIQVGGLDIARAPERRLPSLRARRFGFVFQDFNLLSALTVAENVELACNLAGVTGHGARQRARAPCWSASGSLTGSASGPSSCRAGRSSEWRSPARSPTTPR